MKEVTLSYAVLDKTERAAVFELRKIGIWSYDRGVQLHSLMEDEELLMVILKHPCLRNVIIIEDV